MSFKDAVARAKADRPEPVLVDVAVGETYFKVEVMRLDGAKWASVLAECPPTSELGASLGYESYKAALVACRRHSRLLTPEGESVSDVVWPDLFDAISGAEIGAIAATWWHLNMKDPNDRVVALKKAFSGGSMTS